MALAYCVPEMQPRFLQSSSGQGEAGINMLGDAALVVLRW
jgi:hypothetical protein